MPPKYLYARLCQTLSQGRKTVTKCCLARKAAQTPCSSHARASVEDCMQRNPHCVWDRWPPLSRTHANQTFTIFSNALQTQDVKAMGRNPDGAEPPNWQRGP